MMVLGVFVSVGEEEVVVVMMAPVLLLLRTGPMDSVACLLVGLKASVSFRLRGVTSVVSMSLLEMVSSGSRCLRIF